MLLNICMIKFQVIREMIKHCFGVELYFTIQISSTSFLHQIFRSEVRPIDDDDIQIICRLSICNLSFEVSLAAEQGIRCKCNSSKKLFFIVLVQCAYQAEHIKMEPREHWSERFFFYIFRSNIYASHMELFSHGTIFT